MADLVVVDAGSPSSPTPGTPTTLAQEILDTAMSYLYTGVRVERDKLASGVSAGAGSVTSTYSRQGIQAGAKLSIDLEDYHVWDVAGAIATVQPGEFGSTTSDHATGAIIHINAEFTPFEVFREINNELRGLSSPSNGLYAVAEVEVDYNPVTLGYDLTSTTAIIQVLNVQAETIGPEKNWEQVRDWRYELNQDTTVFPSGNALFTRAGYPGRKIRVTYSTSFGLLTSLTDDVQAVTGLSYTAHDILSLGAVLRCAVPTEIDRNSMSSQGSGRRQAEVPSGARLNAFRGVAQLRAQRIREEATRLNVDWPARLIRYT